MRLAVWVALACAIGCGDDDRPAVDGGGGGSDSGGGEGCDVPDTACPETAPIGGAPCEGMLHCEYTEGSFADCTDGAWTTVSCPGCAPPLAEGCRPPFDGTLSGASVVVGPADGAFRAFMEGERIRPSFGGQGGAMIAYRVRVEGADSPTCVAITATVTLDGASSAPATFPLKLHCGESLGAFSIFAESPCEFRDYAVTLAIEVAGVGSTSTSLVLEGGMCPRML